MAKKKKQSKGTKEDMANENRPLTEEEQAVLELVGQKVDDVECMPQEEQEEEVLQQAEDSMKQAEVAEALEAALAKQEEYLNLAQRVQADFDNFRRRNQSVRKEAFEDGAGAFVTSILPVVDNLERAIESARDSQDASLREGVEMVHRQMMEIFTKRGVSVINPLGEKFNPNLENAVMQGAPEDGEPGTVCEVLQKGYQLGETVLRYAMVKVVPE